MTTQQYKYWGIEPPIPHWFKNLQKAWKSNQKNRKSKTIPTYLDWCIENDKEIKNKVGRPKLNTSKLKRSEEMKLLLNKNGVDVGSDMLLVQYPNYTFMPNGRLKGSDGSSISVHHFLQSIKAK